MFNLDLNLYFFQVFCQVSGSFGLYLESIFVESYVSSSLVYTNKLQNLAKMFAHLLYTDSVSWEILSIIHLNENETTFTSLCFIRTLFQELIRHMGYDDLSIRVQNP